MRRLTVLFLSVMVAVLPVFAASKLYVAVQNAELKNSPSYFAKTVTTVDYGTQVSVVKTDGKWTQVKSGSSTGWIATSSLTKKKITASSSKANASAKEISLAGKGFTQEIENSYKNSSGTDYASVDKIETITVPTSQEANFLIEGSLNKGE